MNSSEAEHIRQACLQAALAAYEQGGLLGLCQEGRFELAMDAIRRLELAPLTDTDRKSPSRP
ncbi:acetyltransferase [Zobellella endophytica]|uniref:Acetyltransferase n=1 Tax=Zobellella endophytica TaxID=2116700 RepID=A0A2P7R0F2_9GAMM|nr:acetyltransferase [Zobellella endophytica]PSJ43685.1 acetyltransferase [Zobellella endophytica]